MVKFIRPPTGTEKRHYYGFLQDKEICLDNRTKNSLPSKLQTYYAFSILKGFHIKLSEKPSIFHRLHEFKDKKKINIELLE